MSIDESIELIANKHLGFATPAVRNQDCLDFRECAVWRIKAALLAAYKLGRQSAGITASGCESTPVLD